MQIQIEIDLKCCSNFDDGVEVLEDGDEDTNFSVDDHDECVD
jgi:hypothetical protein